MKQEPEDLTRYFDGELEREALPEPLRQEAGRFERAIASLGRERVTLPPTVRTAVMARVRAAAHSPWREAWLWATAPRLSPLAGALALAAVAAVLWLWPPARATAPQALAPAGSALAASTRFVFLAPGAERVAITGDWVHWDPAGLPLRSPRADGVWVAEIAIPPGLHHYVFIVNGTEWRPDPNAASQVDDGFGQRNSVLLVPAGKAS
jgi:Glycogen recognition site of AMP-activated protein kinase